MKSFSFSAPSLVLVGILCSFSIANAAVSASGSPSMGVFRFNYPKPGDVYNYDDVIWNHVEGQDGKDVELVQTNANLTVYIQRDPIPSLEGTLHLYDLKYNQVSGREGFYYIPQQRQVVTDPRKATTPFHIRATFMLNGKQQHVDSPIFFIRHSLQS